MDGFITENMNFSVLNNIVLGNLRKVFRIVNVTFVLNKHRLYGSVVPEDFSLFPEKLPSFYKPRQHKRSSNKVKS